MRRRGALAIAGIVVVVALSGCSGSSSKARPSATAQSTMTAAFVTRLVVNVLDRLRPALVTMRADCGESRSIEASTAIAARHCRNALQTVSELSRRLVVVESNLREPPDMRRLVADTSDAAAALVTVIRDYEAGDCLPTPVRAGPRRLRCTTAGRGLTARIADLAVVLRQWPQHAPS